MSPFSKAQARERDFEWDLYGDPVNVFEGKSYSGWQAYLLGQDLIHGPPLHIREDHRLGDFETHIDVYRREAGTGPPFGAVDYAVPESTPILPAYRGFAYYSASRTGSKNVNVYQFENDRRYDTKEKTRFRAHHAHLHSHSKNIDATAKKWSEVVKRNKVSLYHVIGYSGTSGTPVPHLHLAIAKSEPIEFDDRGRVKEYSDWEAPGIDPFTVGLDGGKPVYNDGMTYLHSNLEPLIPSEMRWLDNTLRARSSDELGLDVATVSDLRERLNDNDVGPMRGYLRHHVLNKQPDEQGGTNYKFLPGSFTYRLAIRFIRGPNPNQEIIAMLPFINPLVLDTYRKKNWRIDL